MSAHAADQFPNDPVKQRELTDYLLGVTSEQGKDNLRKEMFAYTFKALEGKNAVEVTVPDGTVSRLNYIPEPRS